ncbi:hypothetical protein [Chitinophaga sancti]|uniref:hypothetical protein n=1 Tax=Chitinophaga sancti TaxID=1004 RepID=UPI003F79B9CA
MKRLYFLVIICLFSGLSGLRAQELAGLNEAIGALKSITENGKSSSTGFDIKYIYTNESQPSVILDSIIGSVEISGNNMYCRMNGTEAIRNEKYSIVVFKEEQLLLVGAARQDSAIDPLLSMQSIIVKSGAVSCNISVKGAVKTINIQFKQGALCKEMIMVVDTAKRQLRSLDYLVKSTMLVDPSMQAEQQLPQGYDEYALVRSTYYNYHNPKQTEDRFKEDQYFFKEGKTFKPTAAYSNYKIVLATPNL